VVIFDTNVIIDIATQDPNWWQWSLSARDSADLSGGAAINDIVFAELCVRYKQVEETNELLDLLELPILAMPREALFLAAKAFEAYRDAGGGRDSILPDFFIGAQALVVGAKVATRDPRRFRTYFPRLELITP
jgi:predicted nucleic acid-binding protein